MEAKLNEAVTQRIHDEDAFIENIITEINKIILTLDECDPTNARTDIDLTQQQLSDIISRLSSVTNMTGRTASIANILRDNQLMRRPQTVQPTPPPQAPQIVQPPPQASQVSQIQRPAPLPINTLQVQQQPARKLGVRTMLDPIKGGRRTRRRRKTRR